MIPQRRPYYWALLLMLLTSACQPVTPVAEQPPAGLRPDAPPYAIRGPHAVGVRDYVIGEGDDQLSISVWYPALNPQGVEEKINYAVNTQLPAVQEVWYPPVQEQAIKLTVKGRALQDAAPNTDDGPYPLVIVAGGWANFRQTYAYLKEYLASHGFVVMSWDIRQENNEADWAGVALRPLDAQRTIDYADQLTAPNGELAGLIDSERLAIIGHSYGGASAFWGGGAQTSLDWCTANADQLPALTNCIQVPAHHEEIAAMLGIEPVAKGLWPPTYDPRVDAIIPMAPIIDLWGAAYEGLNAIQAPTLFLAASDETLIQPAGSEHLLFPQIGAEEKSLVVFENADHLVFFTNCNDAPWLREFIDWVCYEPVWDRDRGHDLTNHFVTAFLLAELKDDAAAATALAPENVTFLGIQYQTTAYSSP